MEHQKPREQRRRKPDIWVKSINWFAIISCILAVVALWFADKAKPRVVTYIDRSIGLQLHQAWNVAMVRYAFYLMVATFCLCVIGLVINSRRHGRKEDRYNIILLLVSGLSSAGILIYIIYLFYS